MKKNINIIKTIYAPTPFKKILNVNKILKKSDYKNSFTENKTKIDDRKY